MLGDEPPRSSCSTLELCTKETLGPQPPPQIPPLSSALLCNRSESPEVQRLLYAWCPDSILDHSHLWGIPGQPSFPAEPSSHGGGGETQMETTAESPSPTSHLVFGIVSQLTGEIS